MSLLELVMIVKNSGDHIIKTLECIKPIIDCYTILDTGSTDNTISNIKNVLTGIKGNVYEEPFINFRDSRNKSLQLSYKTCKYQIILDDTYHIYDCSALKKYLQKHDYPAFAIKIRNRNGGMEYFSHRIIRTKYNFLYKYKVHEIFDFREYEHEAHTITKDEICIIDEESNYMMNRSKNRLQKDIKFLKEDLEIYPNDSRILCYLGICYNKLQEKDLCIDYFNQVIDIKDNKDWTFIAFLQLYSIYRLDKSIDIKEFLIKFNSAFDDRAEPLYLLAHNYFTNNEFLKCIKLLKKASTIPIPQTLFPIELNIYKYDIRLLSIECLYHLKQYDEVNRLLQESNKTLSNNFRFINMLSNMTNIQPTSCISLEKKTIVFCTNNNIDKWSPDNLHKECSGSEIMLINLAKTFVKDYRVFVFANIIEGNYDGVEYYSYDKLLQFCDKYVIDYYIAFRSNVDILYLPNIKNVYLWLHDTGMCGGNQLHFQYHAQKFKKVLCLSDHHLQLIQEQYNIPSHYMDKTYNAINPQRFNQNQVTKTPYRFIYSSSQYRGLDKLLEIIPKIKELFPQTTLYIFTNKLEDSLNYIVNKLDYVHWSPRVSQDQIAIEYLKSDIWLYPTNFVETFCITALEAQLAGCLCATVDIGSLGEIVGNRGIIVKNDDNITNNLIKKLDYVMNNTIVKERLINKGQEWAKQLTYENLGLSWRKKYFNL